MGVSDVVAGKITTVYLAVIVAVRAYCYLSGGLLGGLLVAVVSSAVVGFILVVAVVWDLARKANKVVTPGQLEDSCRGGICWHGVAVPSPVSQVRFRLPENL